MGYLGISSSNEKVFEDVGVSVLFGDGFFISQILNFLVVLFFPVLQSSRFQSFPKRVGFEHIVIVECGVEGGRFCIDGI